MNSVGKCVIYSCGPTLNDLVHIGAYRNFVFSDILSKHFQQKHMSIVHGMNVMNAQNGIELNTEYYYSKFVKDYKKMNLNLPNEITFTTQCEKEYMQIIFDLLKRKIAYRLPKGIYLDISQIKNYGKLTGISVTGNNSLIENVNEKKNPSDFSLWKYSNDQKIGYPGWDIQCASNCIFHLGNSLDYIIVGFNELVHTENINTLLGLYPSRNPLSTKWIRIHYVDFHNYSELFYLADFLNNGFSRHVIKYILYVMDYNSEVKLSAKYIEDCKKNCERINGFYIMLCEAQVNNKTSSNDVSIQINYKKIDEQFSMLKTSSIISELFTVIKKYKSVLHKISLNNVVILKNYVEYLNNRLDFLER